MHLLIWFVISSQFLILPHQAHSLSIMNQEPKEKKPIVESVLNEIGLHHNENSELLAPWADRWMNQRTAFHLSDVNQILKDHVDKLLPTETDDDNNKDESKLKCLNRRVFVPLCGKTLDMTFLTQLADEVVGVEGIRLALEQFSEENPDLKVKFGGTVNGYDRFEGEKITLLRGNYFELDDTNAGGKFGAIYDRGSMVAIEPNLRMDYVDTLGRLIAPGGKVLLVVLERVGEEEAVKKGPPFTLPDHTVRELFESKEWFESMSVIDESDQLERNPEDRTRYEGLDKLWERVYLIQAK